MTTGASVKGRYQPLSIPEPEEDCIAVERCYACEDTGFLSGAAMRLLGLLGDQPFTLSRPTICTRPGCRPHYVAPETIAPETVDTRILREDCEWVHQQIAQQWEELRQDQAKQNINRCKLEQAAQTLVNTTSA